MNNKDILIVVDMQRDFTIGTLGGELQRKIINNVCNKIKKAITNNQIIVFTQDTHYDDYLNTREGKHLPIKHCIIDTPGWEIIPEIEELIKDYPNVAKVKKDNFGVSISNFYPLMEKANYDLAVYPNFEICGLVTNMCVIAVAISTQMLYRDSEITIDASCCTSFDKDLHEKALDIMEGLQMNVINR